MHPHLEEDAVVEERGEPLARAHLAAGVLLGDALLAAHLAHRLAARLEVTDQLAHVHDRTYFPVQVGDRFSRKAVSP